MNTSQSSLSNGLVDGKTSSSERRHMDDIRDRLARAEQDIKNSKENFHSFKAEDFGSLKREVHAMRGELNDKIDTIIENQNAMKEALNERVAAINIMIAKWAGALGVLIFIGKIAFEKLFG